MGPLKTAIPGIIPCFLILLYLWPQHINRTEMILLRVWSSHRVIGKTLICDCCSTFSRRGFVSEVQTSDKRKIIRVVTETTVFALTLFLFKVNAAWFCERLRRSVRRPLSPLKYHHSHWMDRRKTSRRRLWCPEERL